MKRGQAALEFLATYGWAILAAIVVVSTLFATGILRFPKPKVCGYDGIITNGLYCEDFKIVQDGAQIRLRNEMGFDIVIKNLTITNERNPSCKAYMVGNEFVLEDGNESIIDLQGCIGSSKFYRGKITLEFEKGSVAEYD